MPGERDRGIVDQSALRMREATFTAGIWLTYAVCLTSALYLALTWHRDNRPEILALIGLGLAGGLVIARLPRERIVRSRIREAFFLGWSTLDVVLIALIALADGGTGSPLALVFFIPVVFAAMSYPLASVVAVGGLSLGGYLLLALLAGGVGWDYQGLFSMMLLLTCVMSAWQARNHDGQRTALMEISRADPLTGCLNRRGFEERAIAEIGAAERSGRQLAVLLLDVDHFKQVNDRHGHAAGDELLCWLVATIGAVVRPADAVGRLGGDEFAILFAGAGPAEGAQGMARVAEALGGRAPCSAGLASFPVDGTSLEALMREADARLYASRHGRSEPGRTTSNERLSWAATLAHTVDMRMNVQHEHSRAVADYAVAIARALGWSEEMLGMLRIAAILHDVGKVTIPDSILGKADRLTAEEYELIKGHSVAGADLVSRVEGLDMVVPWIRHAHEHFDGSGYPDGLCGEQIPLPSRIMLVADAFDAITSARPYRGAAPTAHACRELRSHAGTQFDPRCVELLLEYVAQLDAVEAEAGAAAARRSAADLLTRAAG